MSSMSSSPLSSSSSTSSPAQNPFEQEVQNLLLSAQDPVTLQIFENPVCLMPCGHSLSKEVAKTMYNMKDNLQIAKPGPCPLCKTVVVACIPNHSLRQLIDVLISKVQASAATVLPCVTQKLAEEVRPVVPFPGKGARFECANAWHSFSSGGTLCKQMLLRSVTPSSFLGEVIVSGYDNGSIMITIKFRKNEWTNSGQMILEDRIFDKFVSDSGFKPDISSSCFYAKTRSELEWVFRVLADHNELPEKEFQLMKRLVETQEWRSVEQEMNQRKSERKTDN